MSAVDDYNTVLIKYNAAADADKASLWKEVKDAYDALSGDEKKTATPLPAEPTPAEPTPAEPTPAPAASMGSRASKRGGKRASKRGGSRASKRGGSRASKRGGKRGGSRSSRR